MSKKFVPIGKDVICRRKSGVADMGGIAIPASAEFDEWEILSIGDDCKKFSKKDIGLTVIIDKYGSQHFKTPGTSDELIVVAEKNIRVKVV